MNPLLNKIILTSWFCCFAVPLLAQGTTDDQLAAHYYREGEFEKAVMYYERLYEKQPSDENYQYFLNCLLALDDFKAAEKLAKNQSKRVPSELSYQVDIGKIYKREGDTKKADKHFDKLIKEVGNLSVNQILELGKAFSAINETDRALEVYYEGRKSIGKSYPFHFQIAQLLGEKGDTKGMINEYLDVLEVSKGYIQSVQNTLNRVIGFDEANQYNAVLEEALMARVQRNAENDIYAQMLIWMLIRQNRYDAALTQVKALDKRNREDGSRVMNLAKTAFENYEYDVAAKGYEYVKEKGSKLYHYEDASIALLRSLKAKVTTTDYDEKAISNIVNTYSKAVEEFKNTTKSWELIKDYAHLKAFYESRYHAPASQEAARILKNALNLPGLGEQELAQLKLELADIYVLNGNIWDASLLYGQIEKRFKYDEIGFEAKLKNAKVFYYSGDFGWSQAQLDVLKGSTSKLIANDAMELSSFITDNVGLDTTTEVLSIFAKSELMLAQHKYDSALYMLTLIENNFPEHALKDNILFKRAEIAFEKGEHQIAADYYLRVADEHQNDILADNALMEAGKIFESILKNEEKAMEIYERILLDFPSSLFVVEARKRYRSLRGDVLN